MVALAVDLNASQRSLVLTDQEHRYALYYNL